MRALISLTTDFGLRDSYIGTMKGVILGINPEANVVDISHDIDPQDLVQAAFIIGTSYKFFAPTTIHVVVVDPGVGSQRKAIAVETPAGRFIAPDNGVLTWVIRDQLGTGTNLPSDGKFNLRGTRLNAVSLTNQKYWLGNVSSTFHGRDIFGPVAAHLSKKVPFADLGQPIDDVIALALPQPQIRSDGTIIGHIVHIDHFGNIITDLTADDINQFRGEPIFEIIGRTTAGLARHYSERNGLLALIGSSGQIEIAVSGGSAARELRATRDDVVVVRSTF